MARARTKQELLDFGEKEYKKLMELVGSFTPDQQEKLEVFENRTIKDVLAHLHDWHELVFAWEDEGMSKNNVSVWYDATSSHAATHLRDTPGLTELVIEITQGLTLTDNYYQLHTDMGRVVGPSDLVPTESSDEIVYAKRLNRDTYTVFNKSKSPQPSSLVTTAYQRHNDNTYELISAWIGPSDSPSFPGTERETPGSKEFWTKHALAWGTQDIQPDSLTTRCPW